MEAEFAKVLVQVARESGAAAGGALLVLVYILRQFSTGKWRRESDVSDERRNTDRVRRELREVRRSMRNAADTADDIHKGP